MITACGGRVVVSAGAAIAVHDRDQRKYQRIATVITSGGNRKPVKLDLGAGGRERLRRINTACPSLPSMDATAHDLRRGAAALTLAIGADLKVVQDLLGHSSITNTADTYAHVLPELARETAEATARIVARAHAPTGEPELSRL